MDMGPLTQDSVMILDCILSYEWQLLLPAKIC